MAQALTTLQDTVVARLRLPRRSGESSATSAMACLIGPDRAVTLGRALRGGGPDGSGEAAEYPSSIKLLALTPGGPTQHAARVRWVDESTDVALLDISPPVPAPVPPLEEVFTEAEPVSNAQWEAWVLGDESEDAKRVQLVGVVAGTTSDSRGRELRRLTGVIRTIQPWASVGGAPVFWNHRVIGLLTDDSAPLGELRAVSASTIRRVLRSRGGAELSEDAGALEANGEDAPSYQPNQPPNAPKRRTKKATAPSTPATLDNETFFARLSDSSRRALAYADALSRELKKREVHMEHLILGLYDKEDGPTRREMERADVDEGTLRRRLEAIAEGPLPRIDGTRLPSLAKLPRYSGHVGDAFVAARDVADAHQSDEVQSRHLLYGVLSTRHCTAVRWLVEEHHVDRERIDLGASSPGAVAARPPRVRAQFDPDLPEGKHLDDLLDIGREVEAICAVIAAAETSPPLSIGLFGDWGTGKSFFMSRMQERVDELKKVARAHASSAYCPNIVQLRFNAWHYMDTDLWASLAAEIFEGLARELDKDRRLRQDIDDARVARARLLTATQHLRDVKTQAEQSKAVADVTLRESEQRLASLAREERELESRLAPSQIAKATLRFVSSQPATARSLEAAAERIGIPQAKAVATDTRATLLELKGLWGGVRATWLMLRKGRGRIWILLLAAVLLFLASIAALVAFREQTAPWIVAIVTLLGSAGAFLRKVIPAVRGALKVASDAREDNEKLITQERIRRETELRRAHDAIQQRVAAEESTITRVTQEIADLERQLEALRADRQMESFIETKNKSTDYTKHFGVVARARHDFERLTDLLTLVTEEAAKDESPATATGGAAEGNVAPTRPPIPRIDRIILYIDDLDRCPEAKVVDVLQAVHLLLAFPLFIVVVGVDSRWLLHSLRQHGAAFRTDDDAADGMDEEERVHWQSTPFNYLEKIFQIPFNLRPMDATGFTALIDKLTAEKQTNGRTHATDQPVTVDAATGLKGTPPVAARPADADAKTLDSTKTAAPVDTAPATRAPVPPATAPPPAVLPSPSAAGRSPRPAAVVPPIDPKPDFLTIGSAERAFMHRMHRLIPTPRAAKRYVNVYRLLRASLSDDNRASLEDAAAGRSRYVLFMLAILTGFPQEGTVILRELLQRKPMGSWWDFVDELERENIVDAALPTPRSPAGGGASRQRERSAETDPDAAAESRAAAERRQRAQRWEDLRDRLADVRRQLGTGGDAELRCPDFAVWAKFVARYSFESGRVLGA